MKTLTHEEKLKELKESAEYFVGQLEGGLPDSEEELIAMLLHFADGEIAQFDEHNKALKWAAKWIEDAGKNRSEEVKEFSANMAMTLRSVMSKETPDAELDARVEQITADILKKFR